MIVSRLIVELYMGCDGKEVKGHRQWHESETEKLCTRGLAGEVASISN